MNELQLYEENNELRVLLRWALDYGTFECSEDNPLHRRMHIAALKAVGRWHERRQEGKKNGARRRGKARSAPPCVVLLVGDIAERSNSVP